MPANQKYLSSPLQRFLKISAGLIGGYLLATSFHLALARIPFIGLNLLFSGAFSGFVCWVGLMVLAFVARNGWWVWAIYLGLSFIFAAAIHLGGPSL
ncbi:MAG: hypothetical protein LBF27_28940 [Sphingobacterium sp.]|jgi:hypothetical protein|nr:hypothetical protein [Sphingobacterium sp.]